MHTPRRVDISATGVGVGVSVGAGVGVAVAVAVAVAAGIGVSVGVGGSSLHAARDRARAITKTTSMTGGAHIRRPRTMRDANPDLSVICQPPLLTYTSNLKDK